MAAKRVLLADGDEVEYDRLLITTGVRARPWPHEAEAELDGVFVLRTRDDAAGLQRRLTDSPRRVFVIGAGFTGSEIASACRARDLPVTVAERADAPLVGELGGVVGAVAAELHRENGVDLRTGVMVTSLEGDSGGCLYVFRQGAPVGFGVVWVWWGHATSSRFLGVRGS
jgi:NADPH-dependent 2,4-dienoyl-CoA reductase/sulfur reductase-like enzyme